MGLLKAFAREVQSGKLRRPIRSNEKALKCHFLISLAPAPDMSTDDVLNACVEKNAVNIPRHERGGAKRTRTIGAHLKGERLAGSEFGRIISKAAAGFGDNRNRPVGGSAAG